MVVAETAAIATTTAAAEGGGAAAATAAAKGRETRGSAAPLHSESKQSKDRKQTLSQTLNPKL